MPDKDKQAPPPKVWGPALLAAWIVPGGGHFLLKRYGRAGLLAFSVIGMFLFGLMMRGQFLKPQGGDLLNILIYWGGFFCNLATGFPYLLASLLGYSQPDLAGAVYDYGTKFLVTAGLLNVLAMVDAFEIASGRKD
ncbi:MAG: DUF6677 family protein [bacterium]|jgi:hypothetical protein